MKKILMTLVMFFVCLFGTTIVTAAEDVIIDLSDSNTTNTDIKGILPGTENSSIEHTLFKLTNDNRIAYCSNGHHKTPRGEKDAKWNNCRTLTGDNSKSLAYIYENGYASNESNNSNNYLVGDKDKDYFITQMAVWVYTTPPEWVTTRFDYTTSPATFTSNTDGKTYSGNDHVIIQKIADLINDAGNAASGPTLEITANENMSLTLIGEYYVSAPIKVSGKYLNSKITVKLVDSPTGAFVTSERNATVPSSSNLFSNNSTIYVKIPVKSVLNNDKVNFSLTAEATSAIGENKVIECEYSTPEKYEDEMQNIIVYNPSNENLSANKKYSVNTIKVKISKKDINNKMLKGATLSLNNGNVLIDSWVTEDNSKTISLIPGTYTLKETKSPNGYIINKKVISFEVKNDGKVYIDNKVVTEIVVINDPITINISKRVVKEDKELSGATLRIIDKNGNIAKDILGNSLQWVTSNEIKSFHVPAGTYILEEIEAPDGYELSDKKIEFTVNEDGTVTVKEGFIISKDVILEDNLIIFENTPEAEDVKTGSIVLYIALSIGIIAIGVTSFLILKKYKK